MFSHAIRHLSDTAPGALPYDAEVEYLESSTTGQYIDTGITFDRLYDFEVEVNCCPVVATRSVICGTYSGSGTSFNLEFGGSDNGIERQPRGYVEIGGGALDKRATAVSLNVLALISLSYRASDRLMTLKSGSDTITGTVTSGSGTSSNTLWLFNDHRSGGMNRQVRISSIKVKKDGEIVRDMMAVRVGSEYCLYDKANPTGGINNDGLYHNAGSGAFSGGSDKAKVQLPYDAEVEYIESTGTQYIDTGFAPSFPSLLEYKARVRYPNTTTRQIMGLQGGMYFGVVNGKFQPSLGGSDVVNASVFANVEYDLGVVFHLSTPSTSVKSQIDWAVDDTSGTTSSFLYNFKPVDATVWLFWANDANTLRGASTIYSFQILVNGVLVRDFVPVRVGTEYCLYDRANPTGGDNGDGLYHNKGTGVFLGGVDKPSAGTKFLVSKVMGDSSGKIKPILKHYDIATSYLINECTGSRPTKTNAVFPSGTYEALDYTPVAYQHYDAEVEYLECSGTQWVDTQWYPGKDAASGSCYYLIDFMQPSTFTGSPEMEVWGCWGGGANWNCWANKNAASLNVISGSRAANTRVVMGKAMSGTSSRPIGLFAWLGLAHPCTGVKIYSYQVRRSSATGVLLQDFIPVRVGTAGYFYDRVSGKLFGTGNLAVGPDTGAGKGANRFVGWGTAPYYDSEVNYVECTGSQYLDTGLYIDPTKNHVKSTFRVQFTGTSRQLMGWNSSADCFWGIQNGGVNYELGGKTATTSGASYMPKTGGVDTLVWETFTTANQTLTLKGDPDLTISRDKPDLPGEYYLMQLNNGYRFIGKFYGCTIEVDGKTVRDYVPVRCGTIGMLYDRITNQLWASSSTDPFIPGADVSASMVLPTNKSLTPSDNVIYDIPMVHAQWQSPTTVTFDATTNGGQMPSGWDAPDYYEGQPYGTLPTPTHATLNFTGWYDGSGNKVDTSTLVTTSNAALTAQYASQSYAVDISNGDWVLESPNTNPDTNTYDGVYRSDRYHGSPPISGCVVKMYIDVIGYTNFRVFIRSYAENGYSYTIACNPDIDPSTYSDAMNNKKADTDGNANNTTSISGYTAVDYTLDGGQHRICIAYIHKDQYVVNDDRGYVLIPKQQ